MRFHLFSVLASAGALAGLAACGSDSSESGDAASATTTQQSETQESASKPTCRKARGALADALGSSLTANGGGVLKRVRYVKVDNPPDAPLAGFNDGVYIVSGQLDAPGIGGETMSWAVSRDMLREGGGLAFGLDTVTREFSDLGTAAREGSPARAYTDELGNSQAYERSRECAAGG